MAPQPVTSANRRFVVTRLDEVTGIETNVIASTPLPQNYTTDQVLRRQMYDNCRQFLIDNPGVYLVYSPANVGTEHTDSDLVWDSRINELPF
jgi:hypothetical protein